MRNINIKEIVGYVPYNVRFLAEKNQKIVTMTGIVQGNNEYEFGYYFKELGRVWNSFYNFKPILRPITDLIKPCLPDDKMPLFELSKYVVTEEHYNDLLNNDIQILNMDDAFGFVCYLADDTNIFFGYDPDSNSFFGGTNNQPKPLKNQRILLEKLYEMHFDIHGLIAKGAAIDINESNHLFL